MINRLLKKGRRFVTQTGETKDTKVVQAITVALFHKAQKDRAAHRILQRWRKYPWEAANRVVDIEFVDAHEPSDSPKNDGSES